MTLVKTKSLTLAVYQAGDPTSAHLAIVLPGRLESKDYAHMRSHVDYLAGLGYHAISFDPPGSWESPGDIRDYTVTQYLQAVNELIDLFGQKPTVLIGHSLGGSVAMLAAASNRLVTCFISLMSIVGKPEPDKEWETDKKVTFYRSLPPGNISVPRSEQRRFDLPYSYIEDSLQYDTEAAIRNCTKPKLFVAGLHDTQNKPELVHHAFDIAAEPKQIVDVPCGHGYRYDVSSIQLINQVIGDFLAALPTPHQS